MSGDERETVELQCEAMTAKLERCRRKPKGTVRLPGLNGVHDIKLCREHTLAVKLIATQGGVFWCHNVGYSIERVVKE